MTKAIALTLAFLFLVPAVAGAEVEGILLLNRLQQRIGLEYTYDGRVIDIDDGNRSRYSRHRFEETYGIDVNYAIVDYDIFYGRLNLEAVFSQDKLGTSSNRNDSDNFGTGTSLRHNLSGTIFHRRPITLNFFTRLETERVSREFSDSYDTEILSQGLRVDMKNVYLPSYMDVSRVELSTDGLRRDYTRINKNFSLGTGNRYGISDSSLNFQFVDNTAEYDGGEKTEIESGSFYARNKLSWNSAGRARNLMTSLNYRQENGKTGGNWPVDNETFYFTELLQWQFGRALLGGAEFSRVHEKIHPYSRKERYGRVFLKHQFVQSLTTDIDVNGRKTTFTDGEEQQIFGKLSLAYVKRLSPDDLLTVQFMELHGVVDREVTGFAIPVVAESHTASLLGQLVLLNPDVRSESIVVRHADAAARLLPYQPGVDYAIDQVGHLTIVEILPGSEILPGTALLISYTYLDAADVEYEEVSRLLAASVDLDEHRWRIYGSWDKTDRSRLSGDESLVSLRDSRNVIVGVENRQANATYGLEYLYFDADYEVRRSVRASASYWRIVAQGIATLGIQNTWSRIEAGDSSDTDFPDRNQNTFSISSSWRRSIYGRGLLLLNGSYFNTRGDVLERDEVALGADYQVIYGKFSFALESDVRWQFLEDQTMREDYVRIKAMRYF